MFVCVVRCGEFLHFGDEGRINPFAELSPGFHFSQQRAYGRRALIRLAESDIKPGYPCAILAKHVQHLCEVSPGEGPLAQHFLGMLIDIHDYNSRINRRGAPRAVAKSRVQRGVFQPLDEIKNGSGAFAEKSEVIQRECTERNNQADDE